MFEILKIRANACLLSACLAFGLGGAVSDASAKSCVHVMKATGKSALRQSKAEKNAVQAFLNVAYSRFGESAYEQWAHVPGRKLICRGGARKTCVASGLPCRTSGAKTTRTLCPQRSGDNSTKHRAVYTMFVDGGNNLSLSRKRDVCEVSWRLTRGSLQVLPAPHFRKLTCPSGYRYVVKQGRDVCSK